MTTFNARGLLPGMRQDVDAELIGQLALHATLYVYHSDDGALSLSHAASGYNVWAFDDWVPRDEILRLAHLLEVEDFDSFQRDGCQDKAFVARCKAIFEAWDATVPNRLEQTLLATPARTDA